jgi:hypothetical protein
MEAVNRRSLLRFFGLGGAAAVGEAMPGIGNVWMFDRGAPLPQVTTGYAAIGSNAAVERVAQMGFQVVNAADDIGRLECYSAARRERILMEAAEIERDRDYAMTDWGGAL